MRRTGDAIAASLAMVIAALPMLVIALLVWISLGRPIFFRQSRAGLGGRTFTLIKFRSMKDTRGPSGALLSDAERVTALGSLLRRARIDELPELWNILRGDMAFVGPRPLLPETIEAMGADGVSRGAVRPGLTGLAQICGNTLLAPKEKIALDLLYIRERSVPLALKILLCTPWVMIRGERIDPISLEKACASSGCGVGRE